MQPFPFFVGCGRSGTTLVQAIFDSHPDMAVVHESRFVAAMGRPQRRYVRDGTFDTASFAADLLQSRNFPHLELSPEEVRQVLEPPGPVSFADAVRRVFALYANRHGDKARYGDKTPHYVGHIPMLAGLFPEGRFVHVIRDGRSVTLSYLARERGPKDVAANAFNWRAQVRRGRAAGAKLGPTRYREVRYEDLVEDPETSVRALCKFLELPFDDRMLRYYDRADEVVAPIRNPERFEHLFRPPTKGLRDWRAEMSGDDVALFEAIAGDLLVELGYERTTTASSSSVGIGAVPRRWLRWQQQRAAFGTQQLRRRLRRSRSNPA